MRGRDSACRGAERGARTSPRVQVAVLGDDRGACLVVQRRTCEGWYMVVARRRSAASARAWIEAHYEHVTWRSPVECTALVGKVRTAWP